jgi:membrane protein DedA with SNARE-associated domain
VNAIFQFVLKHGCSILFAVLFVHQMGVPLPGPLFLLSAGALVAAGKLNALVVVGLTVAACVLADSVWYEAGRRRGNKVLHFMHQFTRDPDFHDRRAKRIFARCGLPLLLVAKFVPGLDAVAPPLAGTSDTSRVQFVIFDAAGAALYACVYTALGYFFSHNLDQAAVYAARAGRVLVIVTFVGFCVFIAYKLVRWNRLVRESGLVRIASTNPIESPDSVDITCAVIRGQEDGE